MRLRILATSDIHLHIHPHDYYADRPARALGLARTATLIRRERSQTPNVLLLDNGDFLQGTPVGDYIADNPGLLKEAPHPAVAAMNLLGHDVATPGNHEFNYGLDFMLQALAGAAFPLVSANLLSTPGGKPLLEPFVILERNLTDDEDRPRRVHIGVTGFLPPQIMAWDSHLAGQVTTKDILAAAREVVPRMRARGADIVIALAHSGIGPAEHREGMENAAVPLAGVEGIDAIVAGHSHALFPSPAFEGHPGVDAGRGRIGQVPAVMPGFAGSHLGIIDLTLKHDGRRWRVTTSNSRLLSAEGQPPDEDVLRAVAPAHEATLARIRRPVARTEVPLHSHFARIAPCAMLQLVADVQRGAVREALRGTAHEGLPVLSAIATFRTGGRDGAGHFTDIPPGPLTLRDLGALYPYPNTICALLLTGAQLRDWLERAAGQFNRIEPDAPGQMLLDEGFPGHHFDVIHGLRWRIDLRQPPRFDHEGTLANPGACRIRELEFAGRPLRDDMRFILATNSYRAGGGGHFPGCGPKAAIWRSTVPLREALASHVRRRKTVAPTTSAFWSFAPLGGTRVLFDTGPGAAAHLDDLAHLHVAPAGKGPGGMARFALTL